ncbi:MAG TPA: hypothetical protein PL110_17005 [Candidatus Eremiobacteraeota bacterium]|nr:MAG: hypothetical protein BWY64_03035 [bacterium ADurb.Bin363]HPZ09800.1 hypothetical protein [Candidatus Eremiobacteraeota bacterium]
MSVVCALKFNNRQGAIISDEEYWLQRRRKIHFCDYLEPILKEEISDELGMAIIYGGVGTPTFSYDVRKRASSALKARYREKKIKAFETVEDVARIVFNVLQDCFKKRIDTKLKSLYGFTRDDLTKGFFELSGKKYEINQESIKKKAIELATVPPKGSPLDNYLDHEGVLLGYDRKTGISCYAFSLQEPVLYLTSGPFEIRGKGKDVGQISMANYMNKKTMNERRSGFDIIEGTIELIKAAHEAAIHNHEVGGYFNIIYIDGEKKTYSERVREIRDHEAKIATEVVIGNKYGELDSEITYNLIEKIVLKGAKFEEIEEEMFAHTRDRQILDFILRGYKVDCLPELKPSGSKKNKKSAEKKQGVKI